MEQLQPYLIYIYAGLGIIVLLVLLVMFMRAFGRRVRGRRGKRLGVSEFCEVDKTRRLLLVRRDEVEHLVMIGGGQTVVIEQGIGERETEGYSEPVVTRRRPAPQDIVREEAHEDDNYDPPPAHRPAPRAPVFGDDRRPRPMRADPPMHAPSPRLGPADDGY